MSSVFFSTSSALRLSPGSALLSAWSGYYARLGCLCFGCLCGSLGVGFGSDRLLLDICSCGNFGVGHDASKDVIRKTRLTGRRVDTRKSRHVVFPRAVLINPITAPDAEARRQLVTYLFHLNLDLKTSSTSNVYRRKGTPRYDIANNRTQTSRPLELTASTLTRPLMLKL